MEVRRVRFEPADLIDPKVDTELTEDGRAFVHFAGGPAYTVVNADEALAIAESWRRVEQRILESRHGVKAVL